MFTYILILVSRIINADADNILHIGAKEKNEEDGKKVGFVIFFHNKDWKSLKTKE